MKKKADKKSKETPSQSFFSHLKEHKVIFLTLSFLILVGTLMRTYGVIFGPNIHYFYIDDFGHMKLSGYSPNGYIIKDIVEVFFSSYRDAHPPLRNVILNLILRNIDNIHYAKLVALVPGIILIFAAFILGNAVSLSKDIKKRYILGIAFAFIATFLHQLGLLSVETRPYTLMMCFQLFALSSLLFYSKTFSLKWIYSFFLFALLALIMDYSPVASLGFYTSILLFTAWKKDGSNKAISISLALSNILLLVVAFQAWKIFNSSVFQLIDQNYVNIHYIQSIREIPESFFKFFKIFTQTTNIESIKLLTIPIGLLYLLSLFLMYRKKSYQLLIICAGPMLAGIILAYLELFPFSNTRHSIYLLPCIMIAFYFLFNEFSEYKYFKYKKPIYFLLAIIFLISQKAPTTPKDLNKIYNSNYYHHNYLSQKNLNSILHILSKEQSDNTYTFMEPSVRGTMSIHHRLHQIESLIKSDKDKIDTSKVFPPHFKELNVVCRIPRLKNEICPEFGKKRNRIEKIIVIGRNINKERQANFVKSKGYRRLYKDYSEDNWYMSIYKKANSGNLRKSN